MGRLLAMLAVLLVLALSVYMFSASSAPMPQEVSETTLGLGESIRAGSAPTPTLSEQTKKKLAASTGFQFLLSYTDSGFEPKEIKIKPGETVRFVNNSSRDLWIATLATNGKIYPHTKGICGSSDLDSCQPFPPQDFWEFTFDVVGEWGVVNNLDKTRTSLVRVKVE